ncbi:hypothetical protein BDN72DRAFT_880467 [Pluteus cervinus]|uniref:Uncharacterized protein n=1 Tax=Pluteus cervinus TaxID=181527 RepID=A0ACD3AKT1_9AGAR|nr:hypothetical protein BDN72DRAFT_880467 [Pluteus cervinus]
MDSEGNYSDAPARRTALQRELDTGARIDGGVELLQQAFKEVVSRRTITDFLVKSKSYDVQKKRWNILPEGRSLGTELYPTVNKLLKGIFKHQKFSTVDRKLVYCYDCRLDPRRNDLSVHEEDPTFMILGRRGQCFKEQQFPTTPTFSQCVSLIHVAASCTPRRLQSVITQIATHARQCFIDQPNRLKVYAAVLNESTMWLVQYDRSGITYSAPCNIHEDPHTFVRIILGLASSESLVGFDTSIFWQKGKLWIRAKNPKGRPVVYSVKGNAPIDNRNVLVGRATRCWRVTDPYTQKEYVLKETWRLIGDEPEVNLLEVVRGLPGVGQLVAVEEDSTKTTAHFRDSSHPHPLPTDRIWCRLTLEAYGECLEKFTDGLQLLEAYRDIVLAILNLWERNVLHRDISINNVLFAKDGSLPGSRGVLIDLDRAVRIDVKESLEAATPDVGTRAFQSTSVLFGDSIRHNGEARRTTRGFGPYPHDYLDDMESLFYVLCWICYQFESPGVRSEDTPDILLEWETRQANSSALAKVEFLTSPLPPLPSYFQRGSAYQHLLEKLQQKFATVYRIKRIAAEPLSPGENLKEVCKGARQDFEMWIGYIDQAIQEWKEGTPVPPKVTTPETSSPSQPSAPHEDLSRVGALDASQTVGSTPTRRAKRAHIDSGVDADDDDPSSKRRKTIPKPLTKDRTVPRPRERSKSKRQVRS